MTTDGRVTLLPPEPSRWRLVAWLSWRTATRLTGALAAVRRAALRGIDRLSRLRAGAPPPPSSALDLPRTPSFVEAVLATLRAQQTPRLPDASSGDRTTEVAVKRPAEPAREV